MFNPTAAAPSPLELAINQSRNGPTCPVCEGKKGSDALFCDRCRDLLSPQRWRELWRLRDNEERARWWVEAGAYLHGE